MKQIILALIAIALVNSSLYAEIVKLKGKIGGKYEIEMEIEPSKDAKNPIKGKYRYKGKTAYLTLKGEMYDNDIVTLTEYNADGKETGTFYLEKDMKIWKGKWTGNKTHYNAELTVVSGDMNQFVEIDFEKLKEKTKDNITGSYYYSYYFLNDMWLEETGNMEVGFNGGVVTVKEIGKDKISVKFELLCGPTYHVAFFEGEAKKTSDNHYEFNSPLYEGEDPCQLKFHFDKKILTINQESGSMECEFGARAYADGSFNKISDKVPTGETIGLKDVLGM